LIEEAHRRCELGRENQRVMLKDEEKQRWRALGRMVLMRAEGVTFPVGSDLRPKMMICLQIKREIEK
jgi:hypothetical protein